MANGTGVAITGLIIGIVVATQAGDFERVDIDLPDSTREWDSDTDWDADRDPDADREPREYPTQIDAGSPGVAMAGAVTSVDDGAKVVALTFSSGPDPVFTPQMLDILDRHDVPATFCVIGEQARDHPELIRRIADEGHTLCSQGLSQDLDLADLDDAGIQAEIVAAGNAIQAAAPGVAVPFFRAPGGGFSTRVNDIAEASGHAPLGWSFDPYDWQQPGVTAISDTVLDEILPGDILVLYDGGGDRSDTVAALDTLITDLRNEGYEIVVP
jgi:peptidoglycan/xylan/chitin deacetylase (PgdA/CDA1 family)